MAINIQYGASHLVKKQWAQEIERAATTVSSSAWEYNGTGTLASPTLTGSLAEVMFTPQTSGWLTNTATLANGEVRVEQFYVFVFE